MTAYDRRIFMAVAGAGLALAPLGARAQTSAVQMTLTLQPQKRLHVIPADFMGLGYEITTIASPEILSGRNHTYVQLVKNLGHRGVVRVGGNTSDFSSYDARGTPQDFPRGTVINEMGLRQLRGFLDAVNWNCIWGLNLGSDKLDNAVAEARAVCAIVGPRLLALEIGNEPDLFARAGHRSGDWTYDRWHQEYTRAKAAVRAVVPHAVFAGPDQAGNGDWIAQYARDEGHDAVLLTAHHYITGQANPTATVDTMLQPDPRYEAVLPNFAAASKAANLPWRICETASYSGGGKLGASDSFAAGLWVLDYLYVLAMAGCAGVNMETGVNHLGWVSYYTPIGDDTHGTFTAAPEYYGLLAFAQAGGTLIGAALSGAPATLTAYATQPRQGETVLTVINKDRAQAAAVNVEGAKGAGRVMRLEAPSVVSRSEVTLGGAGVGANGVWKGTARETLAAGAQLQVPAASAAVVTFRD